MGNGTPFVFRVAIASYSEDGYFNITKAAKHFGKDVREYWKLLSTGEYGRSL